MILMLCQSLLWLFKGSTRSKDCQVISIGELNGRSLWKLSHVQVEERWWQDRYLWNAIFTASGSALSIQYDPKAASSDDFANHLHHLVLAGIISATSAFATLSFGLVMALGTTCAPCKQHQIQKVIHEFVYEFCVRDVYNGSYLCSLISCIDLLKVDRPLCSTCGYT